LAIKVSDLGELGYGGLVTLTEWYDTKRITAGTIEKKEILKKFSFYTYVVIGLGATVISFMNGLSEKKGKRGIAPEWMEHISHGFIYDLPRQAFNAVSALKTPPGMSTTGADSAAVKQARAILEQKSREAAHMRANRKVGDEVYVESGLRGML
jgi:hypothetical protein